MYWQLELILYGFLILTALVALGVRDLLAAIVVLGAFSFWNALLFVEMGAVDVGFTEAVVGAGVTVVFFLAALFRMDRRTVD